MPFESRAQEKWMWVHHPEIAKRWEKEHPHKKLPEYKTEKKHSDEEKKLREEIVETFKNG